MDKQDKKKFTPLKREIFFEGLWTGVRKIKQIDDNHKTHPRIISAFSLDLSQKCWNKTSVAFTAAINQNPPTETIHNKII